MKDETEDLGLSVDMDALRIKGGRVEESVQAVAAEVPCTIIGNGVEVGTLLCSPASLRELAAGFLFTSAFVNGIDEIRGMRVDTARWRVSCDLSRTPEPEKMAMRMYTPGCGKGVVYASLSEAGPGVPLESSLKIGARSVFDIAIWLQHSSELHRATGGVHTAALSTAGGAPHACFDDIGRHNAVDKAIGAHLMAGGDFSGEIIITTGRISSEILHKARRAGIAIVIGRGAPTHQSVLRARQTGVTLVCFARSSSFNIYSCRERVDLGSL